MKKLIIVFLAMAVNISAGYAQYFIDGNIGVSQNKGKSSSEYSNNFSSTFSIHVSPKVGYWLNDDFAVGVMALYYIYFHKYTYSYIDNPEQDSDRKYRTPEWRFSVFGRYKLWEKEKFSLLIESSIGYGKNFYKETILSSTTNKRSTSIFAIDVFPLVEYNFTEKFSLNAKCDFLRLSFNSQNTKYENSGEKSKQSSFGFNTQSSTSLMIGIMYKF